jgi:prepilin-type N-terminal cleavage/methylation domain-containing protein
MGVLMRVIHSIHLCMERGRIIGSRITSLVRRGTGGRGFSLLELLVVISIIALLLSILAPALGKARRQAHRIRSQSNMGQIADALQLYAMDYSDRFPISVASNGLESDLTWTEPTKLVALDDLGPRIHRSVSGYLKGYLEKADTISCPSSPRPFKFLQKAWDAGDKWDNRENGKSLDPLLGTYGLYWNYRGYLPDKKGPFIGPEGAAGGGRQSSLVVSDMLVTNYHRLDDWSYLGSCESLPDSSMTSPTPLCGPYWNRPADLEQINTRFSAGYLDGHVSSYNITETVPMQVSNRRDGSTPFPPELPPLGTFLIPREGLR